jgi:hypothetical protein
MSPIGCCWRPQASRPSGLQSVKQCIGFKHFFSMKNRNTLGWALLSCGQHARAPLLVVEATLASALLPSSHEEALERERRDCRGLNVVWSGDQGYVRGLRLYRCR